MCIKYTFEVIMEKECSLIVTLPNLNDEKSINDMVDCEEISSFRFNSGVNQLMYCDEIIERLLKIREISGKKIWIDLKGRQLRVNSWGDVSYECIELNHDIDIEYPAYVLFRDGSRCEIIRCRGNKILLNSCPFHAVGKGQSLNICAKSLNINGYLTDEDKELIKIGSEFGFNDYMASFVEEYGDLSEIFNLNKNANVISKIESMKGIDFVLRNNCYLNLMAARDDLFINSDCSYEIINYLKYIISKDKDAVCASRIFSSLCKSGLFSLSDYTDLEFMYLLGYRTFMLQDDVKGDTLKMVLKGFGDFRRG